MPSEARCSDAVAAFTASVGVHQIVTRITASPLNYEENLKCKIVFDQIRPYFIVARCRLFADCDKRPSDPPFPAVTEGACHEIHQSLQSNG